MNVTVNEDKPLPQATDVSAPFWEGLGRGEILIQYSPSSERYMFYPRSRAAGTLVDDLEWRRVSGYGEVYSFTIARKPTMAGWAQELPQMIAVIQIDEGPHLVTELVDIEPERIHVGMRVRPVFTSRGGSALLHYAPESAHE